MNLNEFLENNIPGYKLPDVLYNNDDIIIDFYDTDVESLPKNNSISDLSLDKETVLNSIKTKNIKISEFDKILQKYGWYISKVNEDNIHILKLNNMDNGYYDRPDSIVSGLYLHISSVKPTTILERGIKAKDSLDTELDKTGNMSRKIIYPNKRVYVWKLEDICNVKPDNPDAGKILAKSIKTLLDTIMAKQYGNYVYAARLPAGLRTHIDNEYSELIPARYITQDIPPSYIKFTGTIDKISTLIEYSEFTKLREIFGV